MRTYTRPIVEHALINIENKMKVPLPDTVSNVFYNIFENIMQEMFFDVAEIEGCNTLKEFYEVLFHIEILTRWEYSGKCWNRLLDGNV